MESEDQKQIRIKPPPRSVESAKRIRAMQSGRIPINIIEKLKARLRRESFQPTVLSFVLSQSYIIRRGLFLAIKELAPNISSSVLDFGCGSKPYESLFTNATSYTGVDLEATGHNHSYSKVDVFYDGKTLPFEDSQFDAVVSFEVFEHVFNLPEVLLEINRVTKASGYLLISIPFAWQEHEQPYDFARYTSFGIAHILNNAGYEVVKTKKTTTHLLAAFQMFITYISPDVQRSRTLRYLRQVCLVFPFTGLALTLNFLLPKRYEYFSNTVLLARKA
jgi:SAM-dependent methyltransferase